MRRVGSWFALFSICALLTGVAAAQEKKLPKLVVKGVNGVGGSICDAVDGNLVANCGFETGDFTYWDQSGNLSFTFVAPVPFSGNFAAQFGPADDLGFISQLIPTEPGQSYDGGLFLRNAGRPNHFQVYWNGDLLGDFVDLDDFDYTLVSGTGLIATDALTEIKLGFYNVPDFFFLDDVVVVPTPQ
jgi:hypothetical protein